MGVGVSYERGTPVTCGTQLTDFVGRVDRESNSSQPHWLPVVDRAEPMGVSYERGTPVPCRSHPVVRQLLDGDGQCDRRGGGCSLVRFQGKQTDEALWVDKVLR